MNKVVKVEITEADATDVCLKLKLNDKLDKKKSGARIAARRIALYAGGVSESGFSGDVGIDGEGRSRSVRGW